VAVSRSLSVVDGLLALAPWFLRARTGPLRHHFKSAKVKTMMIIISTRAMMTAVMGVPP
jgi:hypothetical protein